MKTKLRRPPFNARVVSDNDTANDDYRVGPGRPPKEFQFKPGQSGNPKGLRRKTQPTAPDLKAIFERALNEKVKFKRGERELTTTKAEAGIFKLVNQFAEGDRHARREVIALADKLGVDLPLDKGIETLAAAFTAEDQDIIDDFLRRHGVQPEPRGEVIDVPFNENDSEDNENDLEKSVNNATEEESS